MDAPMGEHAHGSASLPSFPLRVGPTSRYLVDQDGRPTLLQGDAAWTLIAGTTEADAPRYLDHLVANGFNAIIVNLVEAYFAPDPPRNLRGDEPFVQPGRFDTPNEAYMDYAHWVLREAERRGIVVFLVPTYLGYPVPHASHGSDYGYGRVEGWRNEVVAAGVAGCRDFGRYLGHRFGDLSNLIWTMGGDDNPGDVLEHLDAMARGIRETAPAGPMAAHVLPEAGPFDEYPGADWLSIDFTYSYSIVHKAVLQHYLRVPPHPNLLIESTYERDGNNAPDQQIRRQSYWALLCGAAGQFIGSYGVWNFAPEWPTLLETPARRQQAHLAHLFSQYPWWDLVPDLSRAYAYTGVAVGHAWRDDSLREFVSAGVGELRGMNFASAALTRDGTLAMVYLPSPRPMSVDLTQLAPHVEASWFNPVTAELRPGGHWSNAGTTDVASPYPDDAVLILQAG